MITELTSLSELIDLLDWRAFLYLVIVLAILLIAKALNGALVGYKIDHELTTADNKAVAVSFSSFLFSLCLVLHGVLSAASLQEGLISDLGSTALWGGVAAILLVLARTINDKLLLPKFSNVKELVTDRNVGVAAVQAGGYIGTALIIRSLVMTGHSYNLGTELLLTLLWFLITQALFLLYGFFYELLTSFKLHQELEKDNAAAGVSLSGHLIAFSILLSFYISNYDSIIGLVVWAFIAIVLLQLLRLLTDKLLLPDHSLDTEISVDRNWGAALIEVATSIGVALIITGSLF